MSQAHVTFLLTPHQNNDDYIRIKEEFMEIKIHNKWNTQKKTQLAIHMYIWDGR